MTRRIYIWDRGEREKERETKKQQGRNLRGKHVISCFTVHKIDNYTYLWDTPTHQTHAHTHILAHIYTHTHARTHAHAHTQTHTQCQVLALSHRDLEEDCNHVTAWEEVRTATVWCRRATLDQWTRRASQLRAMLLFYWNFDLMSTDSEEVTIDSLREI